MKCLSIRGMQVSILTDWLESVGIELQWTIMLTVVFIVLVLDLMVKLM